MRIQITHHYDRLSLMVKEEVEHYAADPPWVLVSRRYVEKLHTDELDLMWGAICAVRHNGEVN